MDDEKNIEGIGIVIAAYNAERYLSRAVDSVLNQTQKAWNLVIVDDGSKDSTYEIAQSYASLDDRITALTQNNSGAASARNKGFSQFYSGWVTYLDSDDELLPSYLDEMLLMVLSNPGYDYYATNGKIVKLSGEHLLHRDQKEDVKEIHLVDMLRSCAVLSAGTIQRAKTFHENGGFDERIRVAEDYCYWLRTMADGKRMLAGRRPLYLYYQIAGEAGNKSESIFGKINVIAQLEALIKSDKLSRSQKFAAEEGMSAQKDNLIAQFWSFDKGERESLLESVEINSEAKQILLNSQARMNDILIAQDEHFKRLRQKEMFVAGMEKVFGPRMAHGIRSTVERGSKILLPLRNASIRLANLFKR